MSASPQREPVIRAKEQHRRLAMWGVTVTILAHSAETGGRYSVIEYISPPTGLGPPLHVHRAMEESFHILEGTMNFQVGDQRVSAGPGAFVHVPAGVPHAFWNTGPAPVRFIGTLSPGGLEDYFVELFQIASEHPQPTDDLRPLIAKLGDRYDQGVVGPPPGAIAKA